MTRYVALLRGINLGSRRQVAMADLRDWLAGLGYRAVHTHLRSGNVVFDSGKRPATVAGEMEAELAARSGMRIGCVLRTAAELRAVVAADPFGEVATDPAKYLVSFLAGAALTAPEVDPEEYRPERFHLGGREVYFWCPHGIGGSRLLPAFANWPGGTGATVRNWRTVTRLAELAGE